MVEASVSRFTDIARLRDAAEIGDTIYVYDGTATKRYVLSRNETSTVGVHRSLALQGQTGGGTWHTMIKVYENDKNMGVEIAGIQKGSRDNKDTTFGLVNSYDTVNSGRREESFGFGYCGDRAAIAADLQMMGALVIWTSELPGKIDVSATVERVVFNFSEGSFIPPMLVLPRKRAQRHTSTGFRAKLIDLPRKALGR